MQAQHVAELTFGESAGTGYFIASNYVLTARHVVKSASQGTVRQLTVPGTDARPTPVDGELVWESPDPNLDFAIVQTKANVSLSSAPILFGKLPDGDIELRNFKSAGFPEAAGGGSATIEGKMSYVPDWGLLSLSVNWNAPVVPARWAGYSGASVFWGDHILAVVKTVNPNFKDGLQATPVRALFNNASFLEFCAGKSLTLRPPVQVSATVNVREEIQSHVFRIDRSTLADNIVKELKALPRPSAPVVKTVVGVDEDMHRYFIQQVSQHDGFRKWTGRELNAEDMIVQLGWPNAQRIDAEQAFQEQLRTICSVAQVPETVAVSKRDQELRRQLDAAIGPRAFWVLVRRSIAFGGHGDLLEKLTKFWTSLPPGLPVVLFLCLALDKPQTDDRKSLFGGFFGSAQLEPEDFDNKAKGLGLEPVSVFLPPIDHADVDPWIKYLSTNCRSAQAGQLGTLQLKLETRLAGAPKRAATVYQYVDEALQSI